MPLFTLETSVHPFLSVSPCFSLDMLLPGFGSAVTVQGYTATEFSRSIISRELADLFDASNTSEVRLDVVLQTIFEGDLKIHRTPPTSIPFRIANPRAGEAYVHFSMEDLNNIFEITKYDAKMGSECFLVLQVRDRRPDYCIEIPIERAEKQN